MANVPVQIFTVLAFVAVASSLKCHLISSGSLNDPNSFVTATSLQECPIGSNSCVKTVDYSRMQFSKMCQTANCTSQTGVAQSPANCFNTTGNMAYCCCYGDGCNASPSMLPFFSSILAVVTSSFLFS